MFWKKKWNVVLYFILFFLTFVFMYLALGSGENYLLEQYDMLEFPGEWEYEFSDGSKGTTGLPAKLESEGKVTTLTLSNTLPEITEDATFIFRAKHTLVKFYVDGELVYDEEADGRGAVYDTVFPLPGNVWCEYKMDESYSGKTITIVSTGIVEKYLTSPSEVYLGDRASFVLQLMRSKIWNILGSLMLLILALILFLLWIIMTISTGAKYNELVCLALFTLSVSLWEFTETRCLQFVFQNSRAFSLFAYEILPLAPVPIALYFTYGRRGETVKLARIAAKVPLFVWIFNNALHFAGICDISETLLITQITIALETIFLGYIQISDVIAERRKMDKGEGGIFWWIQVLGFLMLAPLLLVEVAKYMTNDSGKFRDDALFATLGIIFYIISLAFHSGLKLASDNLMANEASKAKSQFLANMSHEIRTPLNAILGFDELILRDSVNEQVIEYANSIQNAGVSLLDIINTILDLSKIESGKMEIQEAEYSTVQLLDNVISLMSALAEKKGLEIKLDIDEQLPERLVGDDVRIRQILVNIMSNAVKYTKEGSVTFTIKVMKQIQQENACEILFSVKDTGIGIREEDRERLFEKFERLDFENNKHTEGTGLGMSIVVKLLEAMGSKIELQSTYGKGSDFYFVLKQKVANAHYLGAYQEAKQSVSKQKAQSEQFVAPDAVILIVDDVRLNLQVACGLIAELEMRVDTAESGAQAIEMAEKCHYDVILMDHMMPGMDGITAAKKIRELADSTGDEYYREVPILALTANAISGMRERFMEEGFQDFISKPVEGKILEDTLLKWIPIAKIIKGEAAVKAYREKKEAERKDVVQEVEKQEEKGCAGDDWNIDLPEFEIEQAKIYFTSREMYLSTLRDYMESIPDNYSKIEECCKDGDIENYTIIVHGLKSSSKLIGAMKLSEEAKRLEECGHQRDEATIVSDTPGLLALYQKYEQVLREFFGPEETAEGNVISDEELFESVKRLRKAAEEFNMEEFFKWEKEMEDAEVSAQYQDDWRKIKAAVRNVSFSETVDKINEMLER